MQFDLIKLIQFIFLCTQKGIQYKHINYCCRYFYKTMAKVEYLLYWCLEGLTGGHARIIGGDNSEIRVILWLWSVGGSVKLAYEKRISVYSQLS